MNRRQQIAENIRLCDEESKKRLSDPIYRIRFEIYKFKKKVRQWISRK